MLEHLESNASTMFLFLLKSICKPAVTIRAILLPVLLLISNLIIAQEAFNEVIEYYKKEQQFSGVVLVATNGKINFTATSGLASATNLTENNIDTRFKIASVSKTFTAVLTLKLVEEGKMNLNDPIGKYYPEYTGEGKNSVTIHHLLTYSSGIKNMTEALGMAPYQTKTPIDTFIKNYCSGNLIHEPGASSEYSNTEYIILHKIIELVSGKSYESYLNEIIIQPLQLKNTGIHLSENKYVNFATAYTVNDSTGASSDDPYYFTEMYFGAGFLYSNVLDLLRFDNALFNNKLLSKATTEKMLTINENLGYSAYGLWGAGGWGNFQETFYYRTGGILGFNANWIHTMETGKSIIILSNSNTTNLFELTEQLYLVSIGKQAAVLSKTSESETK